VETDSSADTSAEDWAEQTPLCSLLSAQFLAESDKLIRRPISVWAIGSGFLEGFAAFGVAKLAPGVIWSRRFRGFDMAIEGLGIDDFSLADGLVEDGVG
jgi:hypothetical protein